MRGAVPAGAVEGKDATSRAIGLGGREHRIQEWRTVIVEADGCDFSLKAYVLDEIGIEEGRPIELIIGATVLEEWEIGLRPEGRRLVPDLSRLRDGHYTVFSS